MEQQSGRTRVRERGRAIGNSLRNGHHENEQQQEDGDETRGRQPHRAHGGRGREEGSRGRPNRGNQGGANRNWNKDGAGRGRGGAGRGRGGAGRGRGGAGRGRGRAIRGRSGATRGRGGSQGGLQLVHRLNFGEIMELAKEDSEDIISKLDQDLKGFQHSLAGCDQLKESVSNRYIEAVIKIIYKVSLELVNESSNIIMAEFLSERCSKFHILLSEYIQKVDILNSLETIQMLFHVCEVVLGSLRTHAHVLPIKELRDAISSHLLPDLATKAMSMACLQQEIQNSLHKQQKAKENPEAHFNNWDNSLYRQISILPTMNEVVGKPPPLRSNIIKGSYTGWEHYYDVQFRLLREDFVAPLRKGILEYCSPNRGRRLNDVYIYNDVQILTPVCTLEGLCYNIQFDVSRMRQHRSWEHSKRLMFGSLLCFTTDHFSRVIYFATVTNRDPKELQKGIFQVKFEKSLEMLHHVQKTVFVVAESKAFFEASRHILRSLQTAEVGTMPFTRYLVLNQPLPVNPPKYFPDYLSAEYNLKWLYGNYSRHNTQLIETKIDILDDYQWPSAADPDIELDQSQLDAIKMALTQEIAVIQGPPGTGKTYIGYKIVQTLLENREVWDPHKSSPILVMCYSNHALDQFLEGIIHHRISNSDKKHRRYHFLPTRKPKIVRIGGRSQSEEIKKYNLKEVRRQTVDYDHSRYRDLQKIKSNCKELGSHIEWRSEQLQKIVHKPANEEIVGPRGMLLLKPFILPSHFYQITQLADRDNEIQFTLEMWLGLWERIEKEEIKSVHIEAEESATTEMLPNESENDNIAEKNEDEIENVHAEAEEFATIPKSENDNTAEKNEDDEVLYVKGEAEIEQEARQLEGDDYSPIQAAKEIEIDKNDDLARYIQEKSKIMEERDLEQRDVTLIWKRKHQFKKNFKMMTNRINHVTPMDEETVSLIHDVTDPSFTQEERFQLLRLWIKKYEESLASRSQVDFVTYDAMCNERKVADQDVDRIALEQAEVIGMTTTGAARYQHIIHLVKPKIVIVEEAAELLESHIVSALNAGTQHLILIGDHKQLRPKPNEYDLAMKHNLHISLFERLIMNGLPHATLLIQHRMRPQIASLVCPHIYDRLQNHESVTKYSGVKGFCKNMYFFHHEMEEEHDEYLSSHSNEYEAVFVASLCKHLLKLGYKPSQITILTAYTGQLLRVRNKMPKKDFEGVKITNIDNFQGEENDIIILSLVRNNDRGSVGFLKEKNRVCVALSRAREGFYCFGNFKKLLRVEVPVWDRILSQVEEEGCLGVAFPLQCPNHGDMKYDVSQPEQFTELAPEGGCSRDCQQRLDCGHSCKRLCHINDSDHTAYKCKEMCMRLCEAGEHHCIAPCYKTPCPPCSVPVERVMPLCGHMQKMRCSQDLWSVNCQTPCMKLCPKGLHHCPLKCWEGCKPCRNIVVKEMPGCGHSQEMYCHIEPENVHCTQQCKKTCPAGDPCQKACWEDCGDCKIIKRKKLPKCIHYVNIPCYADPSKHECKKNCSTSYPCGHSCQKKCFEECNNFCELPVLKTNPECGHTDNIPCHKDVKDWSCRKPCERKLFCGHDCKHMCGEICRWTQCTEPRTVNLPCGHNMSVKCKEFYETRLMLKHQCSKPCAKKLNCGHPCKKRCCEPCTETCCAMVTKYCSKGVHKLRVVCGQKVPRCNEECIDKLPCGHPCNKKCGEVCNEFCSVTLKKKCACGHKHMMKCGEKTCKCEEKCQAILECGHNCSGKCGDCYTTRIHAPCPFEVHVKRFCGHYATLPCFGLEDKCNETCQLASCLHTPSPCDHLCHQSCDTECSEPCQYKCPHKKCKKPCSQPCDVSPCNRPCDKTLECGHQCLGVCGEKCLSQCIICNRKKFIAFVKGGLGKKSKPESLQYIELDCGHIFPVNHLDKCYQPQPGEDRLVSLLVCPACQKVAVCSRYTKIMKKKQQEIVTVKSKVPEPIFKGAHFQMKHCEFQQACNYFLKSEVLQPKSFSGESLYMLELLIKIGELCQTLITESSKIKETTIGFLEHVISMINQKKITGKLSLQLISDIKKEVYHIIIHYLVEKVLEANPSAAKNTKNFSTVQELLELNNSALNYDIYCKCVDTLKKIYKTHSLDGTELVEPVNIDSIGPPVITKGQWYCCSKAGHFYFVPARYRKGQVKAFCEFCHEH